MALTHLVDTSVLSRLTNKLVESALQDFAGLLGRTALSDLELGFSARNAAEWDRLVTPIAGLDLVPIGPPEFDRAREVQRDLASRGLKGRKVPDLLIAAAAEHRGLELLHYDRDFEHIASVTGQAVQWIVPPGSVD